MSFQPIRRSQEKAKRKVRLDNLKERTGLDEENLVEVFARKESLPKLTKIHEETENLQCFAKLHNQVIAVVLVSKYSISLIFFDEPEVFEEWFMV